MKRKTGIAMQGIGMMGILIGGAGLDGTTPAAAAAVAIVSLLILMAGDGLHKVALKEQKEKTRRQNTMFGVWLRDTKISTGDPC